MFTVLAWSWAAAAAAPCGLAVVRPPQAALAVAETGPSGAEEPTRVLPRDALVEHVLEEDCVEGIGVRVRALPDQHRQPDRTWVGVGETACAPPAALARPTDDHWMARTPPQGADAPPPHQTPGLLLGPLSHCDATSATFAATATTRARTLPLDQLGNLRPLSAAALQDLHHVQATAMQRVGPVGIESISWSMGGRVSLPWSWLDADEQREEHLREMLLTTEQKERALSARGPGQTWLHFTGSDPERSDIWGTPAAITALVGLAADWAAHCTALEGIAPETCPLQIGDMAYYDDRQPDPLGHRDHHQGNCVDLRLFRSDGSRYEAWWNRADDRPGRGAAYSRPLTAAFIALALAREDVDRVLFNDPEVPGATPARGHDDHMHLCFAPAQP